MKKATAQKDKIGWIINLPKEGNSLSLFMEWFAWHRISKIEKVINDVNRNRIRVRFSGRPENYSDAVQYINDNLPES